MNSSIPRTGLLIPPLTSWSRPPKRWSPSGVESTTGAMALAFVVIVRSVAAGLRVAGVEERALGADVRQVVEVVGGRRRAGRPLEGVGLPRVVAGGLAAAQRDEDVPEERQHRQRDREPADGGDDVQVVPAGGGRVVRDAS